jgi:hypothetical protein
MKKKLEAPKTSALIEKDEAINETPDYTEDEKIYLGKLQIRLEQAKLTRDQQHIEFDNLNFIDYYWANERGANTTLDPVRNKGETTFQSGTLRTKLLAFLSSFQSLNLQPDLAAYNENEVLVNTIANGMEDVIKKTEELENDEEWKMLRQYEMLKHGYVFVEDCWEEKHIIEKKIPKDLFGKVQNVKWTSRKVKQAGQPRRHIVPGPAVYLGSLKKYCSEDQPYIYTVDVIPYSEAKELYEGFERWKYVTKQKKSFSGIIGMSQEIMNNAWRLFSGTTVGQVEIIKYQDKPNNEFQIILNGVPMLPMGYPLTAIRGDGTYTITQQNLEAIRHNFAYGKSFIFKNKNIVAVLDQMMKLAVLKTKQSFLPPYLNLSERVISRDVFMPGTITRGLRKGDLQPITDEITRGVTPAEFRFTQEVRAFINENTVSPTFTGSKEAGGRVTATQIIELQRQARIMLGLLILAASLLEKKLAMKRLTLLLERWFDPVDETLDKARNVLKARYRRVAVKKNIEGEGEGVSMIIPTEELPESAYIKTLEEKLKEETGTPIRMTFLNPKELKQAKLTWFVNVVPKEKKSSEMSKLLFGAEMADAANLGLRLNLDYVEERFAQIWEEDPAKMFKKETMPAPEGMGVVPGAPGNQAPKPGAMLPKKEVAGQGVRPPALTQ